MLKRFKKKGKEPSAEEPVKEPVKEPSADPTTLLGTIASLQLAKVDKKAKQEADAEEAKSKEEEKLQKVATSGYTDFTDWDKIERPRAASLLPNNNYLSALAINGEDYLRFQAKLNPNQPFN